MKLRHAPPLFLAMFLIACGSTPSNDASSDAALDATLDGAGDSASDIATDAPTATDAMSCDAGTVPANLPNVTSTFLSQGDGGALPTPSGGDPVGQWGVSHVTVYLPANLAMQVDLAASQVTGTGFTIIDATQYSLDLELMVRLETMLVGTVRQGVTTRSIGTYTISSDSLMLMPTCYQGRGTGMGAVGFSRDAPDRARLFVDQPNPMGGTSLLVLDLTRLP